MPEQAATVYPPLTENRRRRRGHAFYGRQFLAAPDLYATEDVPAEEKIVHEHYFVGGCDWWIMETDKETGDAFGFTVMNGNVADGELGYVHLPELEDLQSGIVIVERDLDWTPAPFGTVDPRKKLANAA